MSADSLTAEKYYSSKLQDLRLLVKKYTTLCNWISNIRLGIVLITLFCSFLLFKNGQEFAGFFCISLGIIIFICVCLYHEKQIKKKKSFEDLITINERGISRINDKWSEFTDTGEEFINDNHPYTTDLDIFGKSSIFQWINESHTFFGRNALANALKGDFLDYQNIGLNQNAIEELAKLVEFRQTINSIGLSEKCASDPTKILSWLESSPNRQILSSKLIVLLPYISMFALLSDILFFKTYWISIVFYSIQMGIFLFFYLKALKTFTSFENIKNTLISYSRLLAQIEQTQFFSPLLLKLKSKISNNNGVPASKAILLLSKILIKAEVRYNPLAHFIVNILLLWDIKCMVAAINWKKMYGQNIRSWLESIGEMEKLSSLSIIKFENSEWCMPTVNANEEVIIANKLRHPLLSKSNNVFNDITFNKPLRIGIITGSNMSGKSTFLRTIAVNFVLAYIGAPVSADKMYCRKFDIYTSMRIKDILKGNVSTFYSELLRIKTIIDSTKSNNQTFFLIDEIFSGTNSADRIAGAIAVLRCLINCNAYGLISTHDLELCKLAENTDGKYINYHFREYYEDGSIKFDYKLYHGPSETKNALFLIQMVGIPINDNEQLEKRNDTTAKEKK